MLLSVSLNANVLVSPGGRACTTHSKCTRAKHLQSRYVCLDVWLCLYLDVRACVCVCVHNGCVPRCVPSVSRVIISSCIFNLFY